MQGKAAYEIIPNRSPVKRVCWGRARQRSAAEFSPQGATEQNRFYPSKGRFD